MHLIKKKTKRVKVHATEALFLDLISSGTSKRRIILFGILRVGQYSLLLLNVWHLGHQIALNYLSQTLYYRFKSTFFNITRGSQEPVSLTLVYVHINSGHR